MKASYVTVFLSTILLVVITSNLNWYKDSWKDFQEADAKGYYAYLPAVVVYQDLNFGFFDSIEKEKYYLGIEPYDYRKEYNGKYINKYYAGTALICSPFFLITRWLSPFFGFDQDGYSYLYMAFMTLAAVFWCAIGLLFLRNLVYRRGTL